MPDKADQVISLFTQVVRVMDDVEKTLETAPFREKRTAALAALKDTIEAATKEVPGQTVFNSSTPPVKPSISRSR